uniref:Ig-like domain-containing protein n=1 Tax=Chelonoidis abingdonii TaxID=106734 RepID=A0A8C0GJY3_CHEAB
VSKHFFLLNRRLDSKIGVVGQNITLPCKYRVNHQNDITTMCWGWGSCPSSWCSQTILWTDGRRVTERQSSRYRLEGNFAQGDVSLTIVNAAEADGGMYCCRVEIPGWFNDQIFVLLENIPGG